VFNIINNLLRVLSLIIKFIIIMSLQEIINYYFLTPIYGGIKMLGTKVLPILLSANLLFSFNFGRKQQTPVNLTMETTREVITLQSENDVTTIKAKIPNVEIKLLNNGQAIVYSNKLSEKQLFDRLSRLRQVKNIRKPDRNKVITPVDVRVTPEDSLNNSNTTSVAATNDSYINYEWALKSAEVDSSWSLITQKKQVKVAIIDTGVDYTHPDLQGRIDVEDGFNFVSNTTNVKDDNGHGTHIAGIIAASSNNGIGISGITGNLDVKIVPVKVLNSEGVGDSDIIAQGIKYAADKGVQVINLSLGGMEKSTEINAAIDYAVSKNITIIAASGNDATDCASYTPANNPKVITVSAIGQNDKIAYFSNYGNNVSVSAPGVNILSTYINGKYAYMSGTSMAAPIVTGVVAMIKAENPDLTPTEISTILKNSSTDLGQKGKDVYYGYGKINALKSIESMK
jgi:subtilisin family serine protease